MVLQQIVTAYFSFWRKCGYTLRQNRVSKGYPFGTQLCLQSVVCYTLCRRCRKNAIAAEEGKGIFTAGKQGCDCMAQSRKRRTGFISRQGVYGSYHFSQPDRTFGQLVPQIEMGGKSF